MSNESDHRTDYLRTWELHAPTLDFLELVKKSDGDRFRVYQDHQNFEVWGEREGRITALPTKDDAVKRLESLAAAYKLNNDNQ